MDLQSTLTVTVTKDKMEAYIDLDTSIEEELTKDHIYHLLEEKKVSFGIIEEEVDRIVQKQEDVTFPILIAIGKDPSHGKDGKVIYNKPFTREINNHEKASFRDIIAIPSIQEGERIASIKAPTKGIPGKNVFGQTINAKSGKPPNLRAGKNTTFKSTDDSFYSNINGQISADERSLQVQPLYEVNGDLDLKTGNLDFVGSITIRGNVPTGYCVKAQGDITIHGMVEGAEILAGGSVHISEGISGLGRAKVSAGLDIRVGYINQASVEAGQDLFIENSILHSQCVANRNVFCQRGNIIGGTISAGSRIEAKEIGNRMNTPTGIFLGLNKKVEEKRSAFANLLNNKEEERRKLCWIGDKIKDKERLSGMLSSQDRITSLRQRNSLIAVEEEIVGIREQLKTLTSSIGNIEECVIYIHDRLYGNVDLGFGKYNLKVHSEHKQVHVVLDKGEIMIRPNDT